MSDVVIPGYATSAYPHYTLDSRSIYPHDTFCFRIKPEESYGDYWEDAYRGFFTNRLNISAHLLIYRGGSEEFPANPSANPSAKLL